MVYFIINIICYDFSLFLVTRSLENSLQREKKILLHSADYLRVVFKQRWFENNGLNLVFADQLSSPLPHDLLVRWSPENATYSPWAPVLSFHSPLSLLLKNINVRLLKHIYLFFPLTPMCFLNIFLTPCK